MGCSGCERERVKLYAPESQTEKKGICAGDASTIPVFRRTEEFSAVLRKLSFSKLVNKDSTPFGFEYLLDSVNALSVKEIKILASIRNTDEKFRKLFKEFSESMKIRGVNAELRVLDSKTEGDLHDRWVLSKHKNFNIPSLDIVKRGQYSEIKETTNKPPFAELWKNSKDLIQEWDALRKLRTEMEGNQ